MDPVKHEYTHDYCQELAKHMVHLKSLPAECKKYKDVAGVLKRRETDDVDATQILS